MTAPSITSITFDKLSYNPGDTITVTVVYVPGTSAEAQSFTGTATDTVTQQSGQLTVTFTLQASDPTIVAVTDTGARTWTKKSDSGTIAVFQAIA